MDGAEDDALYDDDSLEDVHEEETDSSEMHDDLITEEEFKKIFASSDESSIFEGFQ